MESPPEPTDPDGRMPRETGGDPESVASTEGKAPGASASESDNTTPVEGAAPEPPANDSAPGALPESGSAGGKQRSIRIGAVVAIACAAAFGAWLLVRDDSSSTSDQTVATVPTTVTTTPSVSEIPPIATSGVELQRIAASGTMVYWAGAAEAGTTLTLLQTPNGSTYVRYLPPGVSITDPIPPSLVVATYPLPGALAAVKRAAKEPDAVSIPIERGGIAVYSRSKPTNVYFAYPKAPEQIEVYDPSPGRALQLVTSGTVTPVVP